MQASAIRDAIYYRCKASTLAPGSPTLAEHPATVNLREDPLTSGINQWLSDIFDPRHRDHTVATLLDFHNNGDHDTHRALLRQRISDAQARLDRHLAAIEAGVDPQALVTAVNSAQADKAAAQSELANLPAVHKLTETEIRKLIDSLGDIRAILRAGAPSQKISLYQALHLDIRYRPRDHLAVVGADAVFSTGVRRGIRTLGLQQVCTLSVRMPPQYTIQRFLFPQFRASALHRPAD